MYSSLIGTFLGLIQNQQFMDKVGKHVAWFCLDPQARTDLLFSIWKDEDKNELKKMDSQGFLEKIQSAAVETSFNCLIAKLVRTARDEKQNTSFAKKRSTTHILESYLMKSSEYALAIRHHIFRVCREGTILELLNLFSKWIQVTKTHIEDFSSVDLSDHLGSIFWEEKELPLNMSRFVTSNDKQEKLLLQFLQESIILLDNLNNSRDNDEDKIEDAFRQYLVVKLKEFFWDISSDWDKLSISPFMAFGHHAIDLEICLMQSLEVQPRKWISSALSNVTHGNEELDQHSIDTAAAFKTFDCRVISTRDWFDRFYAQIDFDDSDDEKTLFVRFASSVYQLMYCGLVGPSNRRDNHFEKQAIVFAAHEN